MDQLKDYILAKRKTGGSDASIKAELMSVGWVEADVVKAFEELGPVVSNLPAAEIKPAQFNPSLILHQSGGMPVQQAQPIAAKSTAAPPISQPATTVVVSAPVSTDSIASSPSKARYIKYVAAVLVVAVVGFGGFYTYSYFMSRPEKIWMDTVKNLSELESARFKVEATYTDKTQDVALSESSGDDYSGFMGSLEEVGLSVTGEGAVVFHPDSEKIDYDTTSNIDVNLGSFRVGFGFDSRKIGDNIYYKLKGNPLMALFGSLGFDDSDSDSTNSSPDWVKMRTSDLQVGDSESSDPLDMTDLQQSQLADALKQAKITKPLKLLGSEDINGVSTWHYKAELDKAELVKYLVKASQIAQEDETKALESFMNKLEFKRTELWVGKSDHQLYQALIETNAPSYISVAANPEMNSVAVPTDFGDESDPFADLQFTANFMLKLNMYDFDSNIVIEEPADVLDLPDPSVKRRDQERLSDARQMMTVFELFYNDNDRYPASLNGLPVLTDGKPLFQVKDYLSDPLEAPTPPDGNCTTVTNTYRYEQLEGGKNYSFTFCLGADTGGYKAGELKASSSGLYTK